MSVTEFDTNAQMIDWPPFLEVEVANLIVEGYQRPVDEKRVDTIHKEFDPKLFGAITVAELQDTGDGSEPPLAVIDGSHRRAVALKLNAETMWAQVHEGLSYEQRAQMFVDIQRKRKALTAVDTFLAQVEAKDSKATVVNRVVHETGFQVVRTGGSSDTQANGIRAVGSLMTIYNAQGGERGLRRTLEFLQRLPTVARYRTHSDFIGGAGRFLREHPEASPEQLYLRMDAKDYSTTKVVEEAEKLHKLGGGALSRASSIGSVLEKVWNGKKQHE